MFVIFFGVYIWFFTNKFSGEGKDKDLNIFITFLIVQWLALIGSLTNYTGAVTLPVFFISVLNMASYVGVCFVAGLIFGKARKWVLSKRK